VTPAGRDFAWLACAVRYRTRAPLALPEQASVPVRGALGYLLPEYVFRPTRSAGPSGLRTAPPPFVLRASSLDRARLGSGVEFGFALNLFAPELLPLFEDALQRLAESGLGPRRTSLEYLGSTVSERRADLCAAEPCARLKVDFVTPTELKGWDSDQAPSFDLLLRRLRDRVSALRLLYGGGAMEFDFRGLGERAANVETVASALQTVAGSRRSARTARTHPLSGFIGHAVYSGELSEFVPWLRLAEHVGVGRQTVWGHGEARVTLG
jgi:hypothetical protein